MSHNGQNTEIIDIRPMLPFSKRVHLAINSVNTSNTEMSNKLFSLLRMVLIQNLEHPYNAKFDMLYNEFMGAHSKHVQNIALLYQNILGIKITDESRDIIFPQSQKHRVT